MIASKHSGALGRRIMSSKPSSATDQHSVQKTKKMESRIILVLKSSISGGNKGK